MGTGEDWGHGEHKLRRQISGCKNPFVPFQHGANDTTCFEPLQTLKDQRSLMALIKQLWFSMKYFQ